MLIKSFVPVAVTTSYRNKNWELKLREGNDTDSKFLTRAVVWYKANKAGKLCKWGYIPLSKFFRKLFWGHPLHLVSVPEQNGSLLVQLLSLSFFLFFFFPFPSFLSFLFLLSPFFFPFFRPVVRYIFHPWYTQSNITSIILYDVDIFKKNLLWQL
jgi:hypothetical protein